MLVVMLDLETSGLCPTSTQILELAAVPMIDGKRLDEKPLHYYVDHDFINFDVQALTLFGNRLDDRKPGVERVQGWELRDKLFQYFRTLTEEYEKPYLGGKNVANFDLRYLRQLLPDIDTLVKHRIVDIGNLFFCPGDKTIPDLKMCRKRAQSLGFKSKYDVTHTALDDAMVCVELYEWWYDNGGLGK